MSWQEITEKDWELLPGKQQKEPDAVDQILDQVAQGKIIRFAPASEKDATGKRLALGRRAKKRGFAIEVRYHDGQLAVRKTGELPSPPAPPVEEGAPDDARVAPRQRRGRAAAAPPGEPPPA